MWVANNLVKRYSSTQIYPVAIFRTGASAACDTVTNVSAVTSMAQL